MTKIFMCADCLKQFEEANDAQYRLYEHTGYKAFYYGDTCSCGCEKKIIVVR